VPDWRVVRDDGAVQVGDDGEVARQALCADVAADRFAREVHPALDRVERLPSSHSPMLSLPGRLADVLHAVGASA
jgi:hypothetical protein